MSELQKKHHSLTYTEGALSVGGVEEVLDYDDKHMRLSLGERTLLIEAVCRRRASGIFSAGRNADSAYGGVSCRRRNFRLCRCRRSGGGISCRYTLRL